MIHVMESGVISQGRHLRIGLRLTAATWRYSRIASRKGAALVQMEVNISMAITINPIWAEKGCWAMWKAIQLSFLTRACSHAPRRLHGAVNIDLQRSGPIAHYRSACARHPCAEPHGDCSGTLENPTSAKRRPAGVLLHDHHHATASQNRADHIVADVVEEPHPDDIRLFRVPEKMAMGEFPRRSPGKVGDWDRAVRDLEGHSTRDWATGRLNLSEGK